MLNHQNKECEGHTIVLAQGKCAERACRMIQMAETSRECGYSTNWKSRRSCLLTSTSTLFDSWLPETSTTATRARTLFQDEEVDTGHDATTPNATPIIGTDATDSFSAGALRFTIKVSVSTASEDSQ